MGSHLTKSSDGTLLGLEERRSDMKDIIAFLVLFVGIIQSGKLSSLAIRVDISKIS